MGMTITSLVRQDSLTVDTSIRLQSTYSTLSMHQSQAKRPALEPIIIPHSTLYPAINLQQARLVRHQGLLCTPQTQLRIDKTNIPRRPKQPVPAETNLPVAAKEHTLPSEAIPTSLIGSAKYLPKSQLPPVVLLGVNTVNTVNTEMALPHLASTVIHRTDLLR